MINESKGTPNIVRNIINENHVLINEFINIGENNTINLKIDEKSLSLKCDLSIRFNFLNTNSYNGNIKFKKCINSNFKNCVINLYLPKNNINNLRVYKSLSHELTHLYELYQVKDFFDNTSWIKTIRLNQFDSFEFNNGLIRYFRDVFYSSLPHEIRANLSSLKVFLVGLYSKEEQYLRTESEKTTEWSRYKSLLDFNPNIYLTDLIDRYDINFTIRIFNLFNKILQINNS